MATSDYAFIYMYILQLEFGSKGWLPSKLSYIVSLCLYVETDFNAIVQKCMKLYRECKWTIFFPFF